MRVRCLPSICLVIILCLASACLSGCGKRQATVTGKVTFNGQHLTAGTVAFVGSGRTGSGTIKSDGTYAVMDAPIGEVTITVQTPPPPQGGMGGMMGGKTKRPPGVPEMPKEMRPPGDEGDKDVRIVPAPEKYNTVEKSPLKYTVQPGSQDYNIELKP
jgi:hypothetical protein